MKFGIQTAPQDVTWQEIRDVWKLADAAGLDSGWVFDHIVPLYISPDAPILEAWSLLAALAEATKRLTLGCMVTCNTFRHPALLAKMAATTDIVSDGRLVIGLGAGYHEIEHTAYGIPMHAQRERAAMLAEACQVLRGLFGERHFSFAGEHYTITDAPFAPLSVQRPRPPLLLGGRGEQLTLPTVARYADQWNLAGGSTAEDFRQKHGVLKELCAGIGRDPGEIETNMAVVTFVDRDGSRARERALQAGRYLGVPDDVTLSAFISGEPAAVVDRIRGLEEAGVQHFVMTLVPGNYEDVPLFAAAVVSEWR